MYLGALQPARFIEPPVGVGDDVEVVGHDARRGQLCAQHAAIAGLQVDAHPGHPLTDVSGQAAQAGAQGGLALIRQDGQQATGGEAGDGDDQVLAAEAVLVDAEGDRLRLTHQCGPLAPRHGQPLEHPAGLSIAHLMAPPESREGELAESCQEGHLGGHADACAGGHAGQACREGAATVGAPEAPAMDQQPQAPSAEEAPQQAARPRRASMDPCRDDAAARTAVRHGWFDGHQRIFWLVGDGQHAVSLEPEQAPDIFFHGRWFLPSCLKLDG